MRLEFLPRAELARLVNAAVSIAYLPVDEDSVGYVTMEACQAGKPVITTDDSGGILDLIVDRRNGLVVAPEARRLAEAMEFIHSNPPVSQRWGKQARHDWLDRGITWKGTLDRLLG